MQSCHDPVATDSGASFLCRRCEYLESFAESHQKLPTLPIISCALCPREGGIFKRTDKGAWVHVFCALLTPGVSFGDPDHLEGVSLKNVDRRVCMQLTRVCSLGSLFHSTFLLLSVCMQRFQKLRCYLCKLPVGACIQCEDCFRAYHAMCAQKHNCCVVWRKVNDIVVRAQRPFWPPRPSVLCNMSASPDAFRGCCTTSPLSQKGMTYCNLHHPRDMTYDKEQQKWVHIDMTLLLPPKIRPLFTFRTQMQQLKRV
jgi:hypothetical protein